MMDIIFTSSWLPINNQIKKMMMQSLSAPRVTTLVQLLSLLAVLSCAVSQTCNQQSGACVDLGEGESLQAPKFHNSMLLLPPNNGVMRKTEESQVCNAQDFLGTTIFQRGSDGNCYKLEFFPGGIFGRIPGKQFDCSSADFTPRIEFSRFHYVEGNRAYFTGGAAEMTGYFELVQGHTFNETATLNDFQVDMHRWSYKGHKEFIITLSFPTCIPPSKRGPPQPSHTDFLIESQFVNRTCDATKFLNKTFIQHDNKKNCFILQTFEGGMFGFDPPGNTCDGNPFIPQIEISTFDYSEENKLYYKNVETNMTGIVEFREDHSIRSEYYFQVDIVQFDLNRESHDNPTKNHFHLIMRVPKCQAFQPPTTLSVSPSIQPSSVPTQLPSSQPSQYPSLEPTMVVQGRCHAEHFIGKTFHDPGDGNTCYRFELFKGGKFSMDVGNDCSESSFDTLFEFSTFDYALENKLFFKPGNLGYSGFFEIVIDPTLTTSNLDIEVMTWDYNNKKFEVLLRLQACELPTSSLAVGYEHSCFLNMKKELTCWGKNEYGQLGIGSTQSQDHPVPVYIDDSVVSIVGGYRHNCVLTLGMSIMCWGWNLHGQLGTGDNNSRTTPTLVSDIHNEAVAIVTGGYHSCALKLDKSVLCWGLNSNGQLGDGTTEPHSHPVVVRNMNNAMQIIAGYAHTCSILDTKSIFCWGHNNHGQLGKGCDKESCSTPVKLLGVENVRQAALGVHHTCVLIGNEKVYCLGQNDYGQIGDGTLKPRAYPVLVEGIEKVTKIVAGNFHTCVITQGIVKCWGFNASGQIGDDTTKNRVVPTKVDIIGDTAISSLAATSVAYRTYAISEYDVAMCWGHSENVECIL